MTSKLNSNWWVLAFNGLIALLFGLVAIFSPLETLKVIIMYFGIVMLIVGIAMIIGVYTNIKSGVRYGNDLVSSVITMGIGSILAFFTQESIQIFIIVFGVWAIILGIGQLVIMSGVSSPDSKKMLLINGLITLAFGILLFYNPFTSASIMVVLTGILAIIIGIVLIVLAIKIKNLL